MSSLGSGLAPETAPFEAAPRERALDQQAVIVTGGMRGIGRGIARAFTEAGARVLIVDIDVTGAGALVDEFSSLGETPIVLQSDVTAAQRHEHIVETAVAAFGRVDVLVNNAGRNARESFLDVDLDRWDELISLNLKAPYFLSQFVARAMVAARQPGRIINIASVHDTVAAVGSSVYAISKGGLQMLTKALALELAPHDINVNAISPGTVVVERNRSMLLTPSPFAASQMARIPMGRFAQPADIASVAMFLAGPASAYMTGHTLYVDGGILLQ